MNKGYLVGGLAIVGAIALFAYLTPKGAKRNSDGFFGASGRKVMSGEFGSGGTANRAGCAYCRGDGGIYHTGQGNACRGRDVCVSRYAS